MERNWWDWQVYVCHISDGSLRKGGGSLRRASGSLAEKKSSKISLQNEGDQRWEEKKNKREEGGAVQGTTTVKPIRAYLTTILKAIRFESWECESEANHSHRRATRCTACFCFSVRMHYGSLSWAYPSQDGWGSCTPLWYLLTLTSPDSSSQRAAEASY